MLLLILKSEWQGGPFGSNIISYWVKQWHDMVSSCVQCHTRAKPQAESLLYPDSGDHCNQLVANLAPRTPLCYFFNIAKLQCKQIVFTYFFISFVNKFHINGKGTIKKHPLHNQINQMLVTKIDHILTIFLRCLKVLNFADKHVDLTWDFGHDAGVEIFWCC